MHCIMGFVMAVCLITDSLDADSLVKIISAGFLPLTVTTFSLVVNKYLGALALRLGKSCFSSNIHP